MPELISWTASSDPGVKYFSGTATYSKTCTRPRRGSVQGSMFFWFWTRFAIIAEVSVNGKPVGMVWAPPVPSGCDGRLEAGR